MKTYDYKGQKVYLQKGEYQNNDTLASLRGKAKTSRISTSWKSGVPSTSSDDFA